VLCSCLAAAGSVSAAVVINEIHYNPDVKTEPAEFIELYNTGPGAVNVGGWYFSDGINYTLPATNIAAGGFLVVAQNPAFLQTKYGVAGAVGPWNPGGTSGLNARGEKITLRNAAGQVVDEVDYQLGFPWPTVGDATVIGNGRSIELIHPSLDNDLGGSWRSAGGGAGGTPPQNSTLIAAQSPWKYIKGTNEASSPTTLWRQPSFNDSAWSTGTLPIGYGEAFIATPLNDMNGGYASVFLRKQFTVTDPAQFARLVLEAQYDDGFKCWINGTLVVDGNANMPAGEVAYNATAISALENLSFVTINLADSPASLLVNGVNTIAVQAHNASLAASSDFFFDARLIGQTGGTGGSLPTPGAINTVYATNAPPQIRQVEHAPEQPASGVPVTVTAKVTDPDGVGAVTLEYQIVDPGNYIELTDVAYTNAANWISMPMNDAGTGGDVTAGDDVFTAEIPASVQQHRRLIRYRITVTDNGGRSVRVPYADDPQPNFAYFVYDGAPAWSGAVQPGGAGSNGVVRTIPAAEMGRLSAFHLIAKSNSVATATWFSRYGGDAYQWAGTLVYDGKVYDHIHYRARGGVWRYSMVKNMWKFDLNRGHDIEMRDNWGRKFKTPWTKINLGANIQQRDFWHRGEQGMFESVGLRTFQLAGVASPNTAFATLRVIDDAQESSPATQYEGDFWGLYLVIEQENGRFLEEHDLPDSNLYKMEGGTGELNNLGPNGPTDKSDLNYILNNYSGKPESWWQTNWNLPKYYSYQAVAQAIHHYDICYDKNFFYYFNPSNRLWEICSWDLDLTWANNMYDAGCGGKDRVYQRVFDEASPAKPNIAIAWRNRVREFRDLFWNSDQAWKLIEEYAALLLGPSATNNIIEADRMMWDYNPKMNNTAYTPNLSKAGQGEYYKFSQEIGTNASLQGSFNATVQIMRNYVGIRGAFLDGIANEPTKPATPTLTYTGPAGSPLNRLTFRSANYSGANPFGSMRWRLGEITDTNSPNYRADEPKKYEIETVWESGPLANFNADVTIPANVVRVGSRYRVRVQHTDNTGRASNWSAPQEFVVGEPVNIGDLLNYLRITEVMFNPPLGGYEFVELQNISGSVTLDLAGVKFTQGIDYTFPSGATLAPGAFVVVVGTADLAGFRAYYRLGPEVAVYGPYSGSLNNGGEQLVLRTSAGGTDIVNFSYGDGRGWPVGADGGGQSLVFLDSALAAQGSGSGEYAGNWRGSSYLRGSPGSADATLAPSIVINEIASHTDFTNELDSNDWIELYNPTDTPLTLGPGWYLSDDASAYTNLMKWMIPSNTTIPARGWVSFDEVTGFHFPTNIGFGLSKAGEQVFLSHLPGSAQDRIVDAVSFKAQENDWSWGRYPDGAPFWYGLAPRTRDTTNAAPPARVVFSELNYHPPDVLVGTNATDNSLDEFVELYNGAGAPVTLHNTNGTWRVNGGVNFTFPTNLTLAAGEYLLLVSFDPGTNAAQSNAFRTLYSIGDPSVRILGPYTGKLANNSDRLALELPLHPDGTNDTISWVIVDEVLYADQPPWPCGSDGTGNSLQRLSATLHGSDPTQWAAEPPTAGAPRANLPAGLPAITAPPQSRIAPTNGTASFSVSVCGTPPFTYQWLFNDGTIGGATNATLTLMNLTLGDSGEYRVVVSNPAGSITSQVAILVVQLPPFITEQPQPVTVMSNQPAQLSVTAGGTPPLTFQWKRNGVDVPGATNRTLTFANAQPSQSGDYRVQVANSAGSVLSSNAVLTVQVPVYFAVQPTNQFVLPGTNVSLVSVANGGGTVRYQWTFYGTNVPNGTNATLSFTNANLGQHHGTYAVTATDDNGSITSSNAFIYVLVPPVFVISPKPQTILAGGSATFTALATGAPPIGYRWLRQGSPITTNDTGVLTLTNVQASAQIRVLATNRATAASGVNMTPAGGVTLTVLADADRDGLADIWETNYFGPVNTTNNAANAFEDPDGDGMINRDEYVAGTNPTNALSVLKLFLTDSNAAFLQFVAQTNLGYLIQVRTNITATNWSALTNVVADPSQVRTIWVNAPNPPPENERYYRILTPAP